jgi:hypothetical protein
MTNDAPPMPLKCQHRVQAVLALFRGEAVVQVSTEYRICRSDLYKFHRRALDATRSTIRREALGLRTTDLRQTRKRPSGTSVSSTPRSALLRYDTSCKLMRSRLAPSSAYETGSTSHDSRSASRLHSRLTGSRTTRDSSFATRWHQHCTWGRTASPGMCRISTGFRSVRQPRGESKEPGSMQ